MTVTQDSVRRVHAVLDRIPSRLHKSFERRLNRWGTDWRDTVRGRITGGGPLRNRTGMLGSSIVYRLDGSTLGTLRLRMLSEGVVYARIHELGGVIKPKTGRFLTIPLDAAKTAAGDVKGMFASARRFIEANPGATYFVRTPDGELLLMWKKGKRTTLPIFKLVRQVELPGPNAPTKKAPSRLGFFDTWKAMGGTRSADVSATFHEAAEGL